MADSVMLDMAREMGRIYQDFTDAVHELGAKGKSSKMAGSMLHWVGGNHVSTDREHLCEEFLTKVQSHLELFGTMAEEAEAAEAAEACAVLADIMMAPIPAKSDSTTDLMRRAMIGQIKPYLGYLSGEELRKHQEELTTAYGRWHRLPVEKEILAELDRLLKAR